MNFLQSLRRILLVRADSRSIREAQAKEFARNIIRKNKSVFDRLADM